MAIKYYNDLFIWQKSKQYVIDIYKVLKVFPKSELFGLQSQISRSAISVLSNIAEGFGRKSSKEFRRFLYISRGSLYENHTQITIAYELNYISKTQYEYLSKKNKEIEAMLYKFIDSIIIRRD